MNVPEPTPLPAPPDFPVDWASPEESMMFWEIDGVHAVEPYPSLTQSFMHLLNESFIQAGKENEMPVTWGKKYVHHFEYTTIFPAVPLEQMEAQTMKAMELLETTTMPNMQRNWEEKFLPEIKRYLDFWESFDLSGADMASLLEHFEATRDAYARLWHIHFLIVVPMYVAMSMFDDLFHDLFGQQNALGAYTLLQGFANKTLETDRALWLVSQQAINNPAAKTIIESNPPNRILAALADEPRAQDVLNAFDTFNSHYGQRTILWGLNSVSWIEDPSYPLKTLKEYVEEPPIDPRLDTQRLAEQREAAIVDAREKLKGYPQPVQDQFNSMLGYAQYASVLSEDHGFWIDFRANYKVRCVIMELARRFAEAGLIQTQQNIFHLSLEQVRKLASQWPPTDAQPMELTEKAEYETCARMTPPPMLGALPHGPPPDDPIARTFQKFFGMPVNEEPPTPDTKLLKGHPGSAGKIRGTARVITSLDEADKLKEGDILVTKTTAPPWTGLFATAGAVVTDAGGVLCHCAVVAREYGIPAVVGTQYATSVFKDGQTLEVNGDTGQVSIV